MEGIMDQVGGIHTANYMVTVPTLHQDIITL